MLYLFLVSSLYLYSHHIFFLIDTYANLENSANLSLVIRFTVKYLPQVTANIEEKNSTTQPWIKKKVNRNKNIIVTF